MDRCVPCWRQGLAMVLVVLSWSCLPARLAADDPNLSPSSDALADSVWFDADQDRLIPVEVEPEEDDSLNRDSRWLPKAKRVRVPDAPSATSGAGGGTGGTGLFGTGWTVGNVLGWILLAVLVSTAVFAFGYALSQSDFEFVSSPATRGARRADAPDQQTLERMKHLPAELRRTGVDFRSEAERLMSEGNFDQAIILLFAHQLLLLDRAGVLRLNRGKTNRRYVRETQSVDRELARMLRSTVDAFERSYFGRHSITGKEFAELWGDNETLEQSVRRRQEAAA